MACTFSHDVAAPLSPAYQEVSCFINYSVGAKPLTKWKVVSYNMLTELTVLH